jgi:acetyltransferase-like isoleucine patch superfamily enzyme
MTGHRYLTRREINAFGFAAVGKNVAIDASAFILNPKNITIGNYSRIDAFTTLKASGRISMGCYVHIGGYCYLAGNADIELDDFSGLSQGVKIYSTSDDYSGKRLTNPTIPPEYLGLHSASVKLGRHVIVGAGSVLLPGSNIGEGAAIGALSLVNGVALKPWSIYAGCPVRRIKPRKKDLLKLERALLARNAGERD